MSRRVDPRAIALIKRFESLHDGDLSEIGLQPKMDPVGIWTAGYGHALRDPDTGQFLQGANDRAAALALVHGGLTEAQADDLLERDLEQFSDGVSRRVTAPLSSSEFGALVSFAFNVGLGNFKGSTLLRLLNAGDFKGAADQFARWNRAGGKILPGLVKRRYAERTLFLSP